MKIAFNPHIVGYGHRIRCNLIAKEILKLRPRAKIVFLDRKDDPLYEKDWTPYKRVHGGFRRTLSLFTSSCLVEDCAMIEDFRRRWYSAIGRIATILQPDTGSEFAPHMKHLGHSDLIVMPYPEIFFPFPEILEDCREKVIWLGPILNLPDGDFRRKETDSLQVNVLASRGREQIFPFIEDLSAELGFRVIETEFKSDEDYFSALSETTIVVTQGAHAVFECSHLGIPQLCLPINREQLVVARKLEENGALVAIPMSELTKDRLRSALDDMMKDQDLREDLARRAKDLATPPGNVDAAKAIMDLVEPRG